MKKLGYILLLLTIVSTTLVSCKKFLEKEPIGKTGKLTLFETVDGAKLAINGAYNLVLYYYKNEFGMYGDITSDNVLRGSKASTMLPQFNFQSSISEDALAVGHIWLNIYEALNNTNNVINAIPALKSSFPESENTLDDILAQGLVLRALCHFDLSRVYAQPYNFTANASHLGIPVLTKTPSPGEQVPRNTMQETYAQIIKDLTDALPNLQKYANNTTQAKVSYQAALALLSRVYLYKGDWAQSVAYANMVINDPNYKLATSSNYKAVFNSEINNLSSTKTEGIFQLTNTGITLVSTNIFSVYSDATAAQYNTSNKAINAFDNDDIRVTQMFNVPTTGDNTGKILTAKYGDGLVSKISPQIIQVIRVSELYLNRAEANWNLQKYTEAAEDLRIISQRAHPNRTITITYNSNDDLYKQIAAERNRELCFENHRFFDIARRKENLQRGGDCNANTCSLTYPDDRYVIPIPLKETQANKALVQNPGYK